MQDNHLNADREGEVLRPNLTTKAMEPPHDAETLRPNPKGLFEEEMIDLQVLKQLAGKSILSVKDLDKKKVIELCKFAAFLEAIEVASYHPLDGKLVITAFFEASTRTRTSFESAVLRLDGKIISIPDASITGVKKGESMGDIGEMFNAYGDLVIMRHTRIDAIEEIRQNLRVPLINAGNGAGEHPTQSLADWYALLKWNPALALEDKSIEKSLHLGILGTPDSMRAVKSFLLMTLLFKENFKKISIVSEMADPLGPELTAEMEQAGIPFAIINDLQEVIEDLDIIYMNSIALLGGSYQALDARYKLTSSTNLKENAVILHPLSRLEELDTSLDDTRHNLYFSQAHGSVFVRQALLISIFDRFDRLPDSLPSK
ncbi:MAG: hypothetical protein WD490_03635 [Opitutales bacterium]